jgi:hypothetical protein
MQLFEHTLGDTGNAVSQPGKCGHRNALFPFISFFFGEAPALNKRSDHPWSIAGQFLARGLQ